MNLPVISLIFALVCYGGAEEETREIKFGDEAPRTRLGDGTPGGPQEGPQPEGRTLGFFSGIANTLGHHLVEDLFPNARYPQLGYYRPRPYYRPSGLVGYNRPGFPGFQSYPPLYEYGYNDFF